jgi:type VI secretion system protein ImpB
VQIEYDVELYGSEKKIQLPFVMGVLADLSGNPTEPLAALKNRKFVEVTPDNFDAVLKNSKPRVSFKADNKLQDGADAGKIGVDITFESLDDFNPERVAQKVPALKELLELRTKLADLRGSLQGNDKLEEMLQQTLNDADAMAKLRGEIGNGGGDNV